MKHNVYYRNFLATVLIVLVSFALLGGLSTAWSYSRSMNDKREAMLSTMRETARYVTAQHIHNNVEMSDLNLSMWLAMVSGVSGFDLLLADSSGVIGACSERDFRYLGMIVPDSALAFVHNGSNRMSTTRLGSIYAERHQVVGMPLTVTVGGASYIFGYLFVSSDMDAFRYQWQQFSGVFLLIAINILILAFVISLIATKKQAVPLNEMAGAARRFARGDFSMRVKDTGRLDEIGQLTQAFNAMADSLESSETLRRDFIANISHELKTPMTVITGFVDGILDGTIPLENASRYLSIISSETRRLSRLVKSMLDLSKLQSTSVSISAESSFDICEVARLALLSLGSKIDDKRLDVEAELPEEPVITRGDKDSITQVAYNLIDNAVKFSAPFGVIRLEIWKQGNRAYVSVENSGATIPPDELPHIFDRFHKADKSRSADRDGVGLGLYIVKTILDNHNEDIFVTSNDGKTRFMFTLTLQ